MCYPISVKTAYVEGKVRSPKKFKKYASEYYLLNVKSIHKNYLPFFNKFTLISVHLNECEAMTFYSLDELIRTLTLNPTTLSEQPTLVIVQTEIRPTMNGREFINYELEF